MLEKIRRKFMKLIMPRSFDRKSDVPSRGFSAACFSTERRKRSWEEMAEANREGITMRWKNGQTREADDRKRVNERKSLKLLVRERVRVRRGQAGIEKERGEKAGKRRKVRKKLEEEFIVSSVTLCAVSVKHGEEEKGRKGDKLGKRCDIYDGYTKRSF